MRPFASSRDSSRRRRIRCRCSRFSLFSDPTSYLEAPSSSICHEHEGRQARDGNGWRACCRCWWWVCLCPFHRCAARARAESAHTLKLEDAWATNHASSIYELFKLWILINVSKAAEYRALDQASQRIETCVLIDTPPAPVQRSLATALTQAERQKLAVTYPLPSVIDTKTSYKRNCICEKRRQAKRQREPTRCF